MKRFDGLKIIPVWMPGKKAPFRTSKDQALQEEAPGLFSFSSYSAFNALAENL